MLRLCAVDQGLSMQLSVDDWTYQYPRLKAQGVLKEQNEDFQVDEIIPHIPCGEGEHIYVWLQKSGLNTAYVAEQLAAFAKVPLRAISYAGRKDKYALTRQWFSVHKPGNEEVNWTDWSLPDSKILQVKRHNKKLKTGNLIGNKFTLLLRRITDKTGIDQRLKDIETNGVPNYFGPQRFGQSRFGEGGENLTLGIKMISGEQIRNRNKRNLAISALRSWLFNQICSKRIASNTYQQPMIGEPIILSGSNSFFLCEDINDDINRRLEERDVLLSCPLWGQGPPLSKTQAQDFELGVANAVPELIQGLNNIGLKQERRALMLFPEKMQWRWLDDDLELSFVLPSGSFATSVIREVIDAKEQSES